MDIAATFRTSSNILATRLLDDNYKAAHYRHSATNSENRIRSRLSQCVRRERSVFIYLYLQLASCPTDLCVMM